MNPSNPFKFLNPYTRDDKGKFFGRDQEIEELYEKLQQTNLLLLYGFVGTGKTSLVQSGLARKIDDDNWYPLTIRRGDNINDSISIQLNRHFAEPLENPVSPIETVQELYYEHLAPIYLLFDQFEELLILGDEDEREKFFSFLNELIHAGIPLKVILIFREEYQAYLDKYERIVDRLFTYRYRLDPVRRNKARFIIDQLCESENIQLDDEVPDMIVNLITDNDRSSTVKLTYLQVILYQLFEKAQTTTPEEVRFTKELVKSLGRLKNVVSELLHDQVQILERKYQESDSVWRFLKQFITADGTKQPVSREKLFDGLENTHISQSRIQSYLDFFIQSQIIRFLDDEKYELTHDTVALEIGRVRIQTPAAPPVINKNPYKGLKPYNLEDQQMFFGRDRALEAVYQHVLHEPLLILIGETGSGKSSLVRAGLIPKLKTDGYFIFDIIRPGINPLEELAQKVDDQIDKLENSKGGIVVVDQFEEILIRVQNKEEQAQFVEAVKKHMENPKIKVILTLRVDFEAQVARMGLRDHWKKARFPVPVPTYNEYIEIIQQPANQAGYIFDPPGLIDEIAQEASTVTVVLPLLSFFLNRLFEASYGQHRLSRELSQEIGGVIGSLSRFADQLYDDLNEEEKEAMKTVMLRMVSLKGTEIASKRIQIEELTFANPQQNEHIHVILEKLVKTGLILQKNDPEGNEYIEPAHDALLWGWDSLRDWIDEFGKDNIVLRDRLQLAAENWLRNDQSKDYLWKNEPSLPIFREADWLNSSERSFIDMSLAELNRKKKLQWFGVGSVAALILAGVVAIIYLSLRAVDLDRKLLVKKEKLLGEAAGYTQKSNQLIGYSINALQIDRTLAVNLIQEALKVDSLSRYEGLNLEYSVANEVRNDILINASSFPFYETVIRPDQGYITTLGISPDGNTIISGGRDGSVASYSTSGDSLWKFRMHSLPVSDLTIQERTGQILSAGEDGFAHLINKQTGEKIATLRHGYPTSSVDIWEPNNSALTAGSRGYINVWDLNKPAKPVETFRVHKNRIQGAHFFQRSYWILSAGYDGEVVVYNYLKKDTVLWMPRSVPFKISSSCVAQSIPVFAVGTENGIVKLWQVQPDKGKMYRAEEKLTLKAHDGPIRHLTFSEDGKSFLTVSEDKSAKLWSQDGKLLKTYLGHEDALLAADLIKNGDLVLTAGQDRIIKVWPRKNYVEAQLIGHDSSITSVCILGKGTNYRFVTSSLDEKWGIWSRNGKPEGQMKNFGERMLEIKAAPNGKYLAMAGFFSPEIFLATPSGEQLKTRFAPHINSAPVRGIAIFPDSDHILSCHTDGHIRLWNRNGELRWEMKATDQVLRDIAVSPDGLWVASGGLDNRVTLWEVRQEGDSIFLQKRHTLEGHQDRVECLHFSPNSQYLLSGSWDNSFKMWNLKGELIRTFIGHTSDVQAVDFSPDGTLILSASSDNTVKLWTTGGKSVPSVIKDEDSIWDAEFTPDGKYILTGSKSGKAKLWPVDASFAINEIPPLSDEQLKKYDLKEDK